MRNIIKNIQLLIDGNPADFRLTKLDAFSGAALLQMLARLPSSGHSKRSEESPEQGDASARSARHSPDLSSLFASLSPADLRSLMTACLNHVEVLLPAGYQPVMQGPSWSWPELAHDAAACLKLTLEEALWTLSGFFGEGGSASRPAEPDSTLSTPRT